MIRPPIVRPGLGLAPVMRLPEEAAIFNLAISSGGVSEWLKALGLRRNGRLGGLRRIGGPGLEEDPQADESYDGQQALGQIRPVLGRDEDRQGVNERVPAYRQRQPGGVATRDRSQHDDGSTDPGATRDA